MISQEQLNEIRDFLEKSQNPLFFFDNDVDGLCSFLILQRALGRGKGVAIKSFPDLNESYLRKIQELNPDFVFILDKPKVSEEFINQVYEKNIPIIWIDHHEVQIDKRILEKVSYYNSFPSAEPVTYISQKIFKRKQDVWLAMIGCIGDVYMPDFAQEYSEQNPELFDSNLQAFDSLYLTELGKTVKMLNFALKDTTTNVLKLMRYLLNANSIQDILKENNFTKQLHYRYRQLNNIFEKLMKKAESQIKEQKADVLFFEYSGETSMSSELSNSLYFKHKPKSIAVIYKGNEKANISIRGKNAKTITLKAIQGIEGATGGGHDEATGVQVPLSKLAEFKENLRKEGH